MIMIKCLICDKEFNTIRGLSVHIVSKHCSKQEYYDKFLKASDEGFCLTCGLELQFKTLIDGYGKFCSSGCVSKCEEIKKKKQKTCLKNFGVSNCFSSEKIKKQIEKTNLERYGTKHPNHTAKLSATLLERYGKSNASQIEEFKYSRGMTNLKRYGHKNAMQNKNIQNRQQKTLYDHYEVVVPYKCDEIKKRGIDTCQENFGVDNPSQSGEIQKKKIDTCQKNFGVDFPMESSQIREKSRHTCLKKYDFEFWVQTKQFRDKYKETSMENYGVEHWTKTSEARSIMRNSRIKFLKTIPGFAPTCGYSESQFIFSLRGILPFNIKSQKYIYGYILDAYIPFYNIDIEFDEKYHKQDLVRKKDNIRSEDLYIHDNIKTLRVKECEWANDPNLQLLKICWALS